jgi:hypothetical protein
VAELPIKAVLLASSAYCTHGDRAEPAWAPCADCYRIVELMIAVASPILCRWVANKIAAEERASPPGRTQLTYAGGLRRAARVARTAFDDQVSAADRRQLAEAAEKILRGESR